MTVEKERLVSLIEFAEQLTRLRTKPVATVSNHDQFSLYEHHLRQLPGIVLNEDDVDGEIWLSIYRLHATEPPEIENPSLLPWVQLARTPDELPRIKVSVATADLPGTDALRSDDSILFAEYHDSPKLQISFDAYVSERWTPWATAEKLRRTTIGLYAKLFTLKQQLEGNITEFQIELVWGVGLGIWQHAGVPVSYPLVTRLVELALNADTSAIEVRPRNTDARIEIDWYAAADNPGVIELDRTAKQFFAGLDKTVSPFDPGTFEPLLRSAASELDAQGVYWPDYARPGDRVVPKADGHLKVTDTWVLFSRPRSNNIFLQDLERLKNKAQQSELFPPAVAAIVTDPETANIEPDLPSYRGISASHGGENARDLFFPKPYNEEQVRIIQLLEGSNAVVVQGPPGTGKTHTIANIICHYLANGKRVLVTSMKDAALGVLRDQLPSEIRPLAIALLTSEQEGMKQFEYAINKVASGVQLDRAAKNRLISEIEEEINFLHSSIARADRKIEEWASAALSNIVLDGDIINPLDAAKEVIQYEEDECPITDRLGIDLRFAPPLSDDDLIELRTARRNLGNDINYLRTSLPQILDFPDLQQLCEVHQDLVAFVNINKDIDSGDTPRLIDSSQETLAMVQQLETAVNLVQRLRRNVQSSGRSWDSDLRNQVRSGKNDGLLAMLDELGSELQSAVDSRNEFIGRPVTIPEGLQQDQELLNAINNLALDKKPFGMFGSVLKSKQNRTLNQILVLGSCPDNSESWQHVLNFLILQKTFSELAIRWNTLADELPIQRLNGTSSTDCVLAAEEYAAFETAKELVKAERNLVTGAAHLFPMWAQVLDVTDNEQHFATLERSLKVHLAKNRLSNVWKQKDKFQRVLDGRTGRITDNIRSFISSSLGNPEVSVEDFQAEWSALMAELSRLHGLSSSLASVATYTEAIAVAGAPIYAQKLCEPMTAPFDSLLPNNWRTAWRTRRLRTHLESIDVQEQLKLRAKERTKLASDLAKKYNDIVVERTWLKLAERASPSVRSALQAYLSAIQKIGAGTGKRAMRYRQDARQAGDQASPAIPCWIMAHYRVSESLPAELGCFDLVVIDEASQSDFQAFPAILRAQKMLIVGDDKQVSPEGVGIEEAKVVGLMKRFLDTQVSLYRHQMTPERSIYDLLKVVFAHSTVMLKEHFRCVRPIIEYSKREFYNHELNPLRLPKASERLDPPLVDVIIKDGYRSGDINRQEARFIVNEILEIAIHPKMSKRSIGVVSLLGDKQAPYIWNLLTQELDTETIERHRITCGDPRTFQGKERDIMFVSMIVAPNDLGIALTRDTFAQRFNVAASRARDRMYLVRSVELGDLSQADILRRGLIAHFSSPFSQDETHVQDMRDLCESDFEREIYDELVNRGYIVIPQVKVGPYRIDLVVEGANDARLAIECDGDKYHGADRWVDDMDRQRVLERAGWVFWRCFASAFVRRREQLLGDLIHTLAEMNIAPIAVEGRHSTIHVERRVVLSSDETKPDSEQELGGDDDIKADSQASLELLVNAPEDDNHAGQPSEFSSAHHHQPALATYKSPEMCLPYDTYQIAQIQGDLNDFLGIEASPKIKRVIEEVVQKEGPICLPLVAKRVAAHWGIGKIGSRIDDRIGRIAHVADILQVKVGERVFLWPRNIIPSEYRTFRVPDNDPTMRRASDELPPEEIANAARHILNLEGSVTMNELIVKTARVFEYARAGGTVAANICVGLELLITRGDASEQDGLITCHR
jgi:very-short-patch-repair endonuclease